MRGRVRGITVEIDGNTTGLQNALADVNKRSQSVQKELRDVDRLLKFDPSNTELLAQRQELLGEAIATTSEKLDTLKQAEAEVQAQFERGEIKEEQYRAFQREIADTESRLKYFQGQLGQSQSKLERFGGAMQKASERTKKASETMTKHGKTLTKNVTAPILAAGTALGVAAVKAGQWADSMLDTASMTGVSTDSLQAFERMEAKAGLTTGTLASQVQTLNKRFADGELDAKKVGIAVEKMGYSFEDFVNLPAEEKMDALMGSMQGMSQQERIDLANLLGVTDLLPVLDAADGEWNDFKESMSEGAIPKDQLETMANFSNGMAEIGQQMKLLLIKALIPLIEKFEEFRPLLQEKLVPIMENVGEWIAKLVDWFFNLDGGIQGTILAIIGIIAAAGPLLLIFAPIVKIIGILIGVVGTLATGIAALSLPILIAIGAIAALIAIGILLWRNWDTIVEMAQNLAKNIKQKFTEFRDNVATKMGETWESIKSIWDRTMSFFTDIDLRQIGKDIIQGLINGINSMATAVWDSAKGIAKSVGDSISSFLRLGSPSRLLMDMGEDTGEGLIIGMEKTLSRVKSASEKMAHAVVPDFDNGNQSPAGAASGRSMVVNLHSPKALDVREANKEFNRTLNRMALMW
jgi:hypothetical protein